MKNASSMAADIERGISFGNFDPTFCLGNFVDSGKYAYQVDERYKPIILQEIEDNAFDGQERKPGLVTLLVADLALTLAQTFQQYRFHYLEGTLNANASDRLTISQEKLQRLSGAGEIFYSFINQHYGSVPESRLFLYIGEHEKSGGDIRWTIPIFSADSNYQPPLPREIQGAAVRILGPHIKPMLPYFKACGIRHLFFQIK